jgi:hypothetical protein
VTSLPFTVSMLYGAARATGLVRLEGMSLLVEYELKDRVFGLIRSELKEVRLPLRDVESIAVERGWWGDVLVLRVSTLRAARTLPGQDKGTVRLDVARKDRAAAEQLANAVQAALLALSADRL